MRVSRGHNEKGSEAGYNLVILIVAVTVLNILVAAAIPLWRTAIKREKEEELISRGFQYAEAIRVFQHRYGRLPVRLEELVEVKPRCIRQLWSDPVTGKRDWVPIRVGVPEGVPVPGQPQPPQKPPSDADDESNGGDEVTQPGAGEDDGNGRQTPDGNVALGPIRGVRSRSHDKAIKKLFDQEHYDQWQFTVEALGSAGGGFVHGGVGVPSVNGTMGRQQSARWIGRPFRPGVQPNFPSINQQPGGPTSGQPKQPRPPAPKQ
jgi:type II secretory pathway pseudopilin PulG